MVPVTGSVSGVMKAMSPSDPFSGEADSKLVCGCEVGIGVVCPRELGCGFVCSCDVGSRPVGLGRVGSEACAGVGRISGGEDEPSFGTGLGLLLSPLGRHHLEKKGMIVDGSVSTEDEMDDLVTGTTEGRCACSRLDGLMV